MSAYRATVLLLSLRVTTGQRPRISRRERLW